jgi:DNA segregation ATPase FtsK/SpoIIIE-like protein
MTREMTKPTHISTSDMPGNKLNQMISEFKREYRDKAESDWENEKEHLKPDPLFGYVSADERDDLYEEAERLTREAGQASTSYLQRKMGIGYSRAAKLVDMLEEREVIAAADGSKPRTVIEHHS